MVDVKLHLGDCLDFMRSLPDGGVDAVITDPPYGIHHSSNHGASWQGTEIEGDGDTRIRDAIVDYFAVFGLPMAIFGMWKVASPLHTRGVLVWDKGPAFGMGDLSFPFKPSWEQIYILGDGWKGSRDEGVIRNHLIVSWESKGRVHPHQKPVSLLMYLLSKLPDVKTVLDPCMGSGTTGVACVKTGRNFIGCEISKEYFRIAERRIAEAQLQLPLFDNV